MWYNSTRILKDLLKNTNHLFPGDICQKLQYKWWNLDSISWTEQKQDKIKMIHPTFIRSLLLVFWGERGYHLSRVVPLTRSAFLRFPPHRSCFTRRWSWQTISPPMLCSIRASGPTFLLKLQILSVLSTLLDSISQVEGHLIFSFRLEKLATPVVSHLIKYQF